MSAAPPPKMRPLRLHLRFRADGEARAGGRGANRRAALALRAAFDVRDAADDADLQVCSFDWDAPAAPPRLFLDHGSFADAAFWAYTIRRLRPGDTILVTSEVCVRVAERLLRPESVRILNVPLPVDLDQFRPPRDRAALRRDLEAEHGIPRTGPLLLVAAAFVRRKNQHHALDLLGALRRTLPEARMVLAGSVPDRPESRRYRDRIEALARETGLRDAVHLVGAQSSESMARLMTGADALVHLSTCRLENFGLVAAEAAASGLPILAADWGGLRDIVRHGATGFLAPTWLSQGGPRVDWRTLVEPAVRMLGDDALRDSISAAARLRAETEFGVATHAERLRGAVESAAAWSREGAAPVTLTPEGEDLAFRTIALNAAHPEIRDAGDEFRLLLPLEGGRYVRLLAGPAATFERPPGLRRDDRPAALVRWEEGGDGIEVVDPVWPSRAGPGADGAALLRRCDGATPFAAILDEAKDSPAAVARLEALAQSLVDAGVLGPGRPFAP